MHAGRCQRSQTDVLTGRPTTRFLVVVHLADDMELFAVSFVLNILALLPKVSSLIQPIRMPDKLSACYQERTRHINVTEFPSQDINSFCINEYLWETAGVRYHHHVSNETLSYIGALFRKLVGDHWNHRHKRQITLTRRRRREVRTLSDREWQDFVRRLNWLKLQTDIFPNRFDAIASFHQGITSHSAHGGPNFYGWHRCYLLLMESALGTSIPYWDSTLDYRMVDPTRSVVWSPYYFGNGNGLVTSGPFRSWRTLGIPITRNIGSDGSLLSKEVIDRVLSRQYTFQITEGSSSPIFSLEGIHNGPHAWVDGSMGISEWSTIDPVFFLLHAHIDYIWERFRNQQRQLGIDPSRDYPVSARPFHQALRPVDGMPALRNIDCYNDFFANLVQYEESPTCPNCGDSNMLTCLDGECVSIENPQLPFQSRNRPDGYTPAEPVMAQHVLNTRIGNRLLDPRTLARRLGLVSSTHLSPRISQVRNPFFNTFMFRRRRSTGSSRRQRQSLDQDSRGLIKLLTDNDILLHKDYENTFVIDGEIDVDKWSFIPVKIIYERPSIVYQNQMRHSILQRLMLNQVAQLAKHEKCLLLDNNTTRVYVQSDGINYSGRYKDYATFVTTDTSATELTYVGIKNPVVGPVTAYVTAYDSCGRACKPMCRVPRSTNVEYTPCSGAVKITSDSPKMYSESIIDAVEEIINIKDRQHERTAIQIDSPIVFVCDTNIKWPWVLNN